MMIPMSSEALDEQLTEAPKKAFLCFVVRWEKPPAAPLRVTYEKEN